MPMSFGLVVRFWPCDRNTLARSAELVRRAEGCGIERIGINDTSFMFGDAGARLTLAALATGKGLVGLQPTNPVTREPQLMASLLAAVDMIAPGGVFMNIGSGDSAVMNIGRKPASRREMREYVECVRSILRTGTGTYADREQSVGWGDDCPIREIPIGILAEGPKTIELAGEVGDSVVIGAGLTRPVLLDSIERVRSGAARASRDPGNIDLWCVARCAIARGREDAIYSVKGPLSSILNHAMRFGLEGKMVPDDLRDKITSYVDGYILAAHTQQANVIRMDEFGLTDFALERWALVGRPDDWIERILEIAKAGAHGIWISFPSSIDAQEISFRLFEKEVLPYVR